MSTPLGKPGSPEHKKVVDTLIQRFEYYRDQRLPVLQETLEFWDLFLTKKREFRQKGEEWRANLALPDAYASVEAKVANLVSIILSADPVVQPEGVHDSTIDSSKSVERLLDYGYRKNQFSKFLSKLVRSQRVAGTAFFKMTWVNESHTFTLSRDPAAVQVFEEALAEISQNPGIPPPPNWMTEPEAFEKWRSLVNTAGVAKVPAPPLDGPQTMVLYRGPRLNLLPISSVYVDPLNDEISTQNLVIYRAVKPTSWLLKKTSEGLYDKEAVAYALEGWDGRVAEDEEVELAMKMGIQTDSGAAADPYYTAGAVELLEVWQPGGELPYMLICNRKAAINTLPTQLPFIHGEVGIGAVRSTVVPGHFYGISDLKPPKDLFWEKRKLRNLRVDAVTLNVLPAFTRLREVGLPEMMHKIRPGQLIPVSRADAIQPLVRDPLPGEAYQEPRELDADIADSMGVYASTKGAPASIGRVTGTEFQGRENRAQIRFKLESIFLEEDLYPINRQMIALYAQFGDDPLRLKVGGSPDPVLDLSRTDLIEAMEQQWRFRGPNKAINRDMQVQQLLMWTKTFGQQLTPQEFRYAAKMVLDLLDIRGSSKLVSDEGTSQKVKEYEAAAAAQQGQQAAAGQQTAAAAETAPPQVNEKQAQAMEKGGQQ